MIGYLIEQELGNRLPFERPLATLLTMIEVDPARPGVRRSRPSRSARSTPPRRRPQLEQERGWTFRPDGDRVRRVVPSPAPKRIFEHRQISWLLEPVAWSSAPAGAASRPPTTSSATSTASRPSSTRTTPAACCARDLDADVFVMATDTAGGVPGLRHRPEQRGRSARPTPTRCWPSTATSSRPARCCPRSSRPATSPGPRPAGGHRPAGRHRSACSPARPAPASRPTSTGVGHRGRPRLEGALTWHSASTPKSASCAR